MTPLRRHQLAYLSATGWAQVLGRPWDAVARGCLSHWAARRLPLVVTRQPLSCATSSDLVALGLPAPEAWERRRLALQVPRSHIAWLDEFPLAADAARWLPSRTRAPMRAVLEGLVALHAPARVYGSHGWQLISGERYVHPDSDFDVWVGVEDEAQADAAASRLASLAIERPRLDGELLFLDGSAVAWREWSAWRAGRARGVLVKRLSGAAIEHGTVFSGGLVPIAA